MARKTLLVVMIAVLLFLGIKFATASESKKRFVMHLLKQAPYLPGRYYA